MEDLIKIESKDITTLKQGDIIYSPFDKRNEFSTFGWHYPEHKTIFEVVKVVDGVVYLDKVPKRFKEDKWDLHLPLSTIKKNHSIITSNHETIINYIKQF